MKNRWIGLGRVVLLPALLSALLSLSGCGSRNDANEHNFSAAIAQYLSDNGDLCLDVGPFPVDVVDNVLRRQASEPHGLAARMAALQQAGLVNAVDVSLGQLSFTDDRPTGQRLRARRYDLTTAGRDAYRQFVADELVSSGKKQPERGDLCYGKLGLEKITGWEGPTQVDGREEASVHYLYQVSQLAAWAKIPAMTAAFPFIANTIDGAGQQTLSTTLVLGTKGWAAKRP